MSKRGAFIASTGQNVGKTTTCLGLLSGLKKRFASVGFMKPVGQEQIEIESCLLVDKDVALFKEHFSLGSSYKDMSPVLLPQGFTRHYLDGKFTEKDLSSQICSSFDQISSQNAFTLVEGTGHISVGSIVNMNNAQVASLLGLPILLVASGGLGSSFDELALNKAMCDKHGVKVAGVILNRVLPEKREMIIDYMGRALKRWDIPLIGSIPYAPFLSFPSMKDFEVLFSSPLLSGKSHSMRHFKHAHLMTSFADALKEMATSNLLLIAPASREDLVLSALSEDRHAGLILTGEGPPSQGLLETIKKADVPSLHTSLNSEDAMRKIVSFTAKIRKEDSAKICKAIEVVEEHIDFKSLQDILAT